MARRIGSPVVGVASGGAARPSARSRHVDIAEDALIGDLHTAAIVGTDGRIDWSVV